MKEYRNFLSMIDQLRNEPIELSTKIRKIMTTYQKLIAHNEELKNYYLNHGKRPEEKHPLESDLEKLLTVENIPMIELIYTSSSQNNVSYRPIRVDDRYDDIALSLLRVLSCFETDIITISGMLTCAFGAPGEKTVIAKHINDYMEENDYHYDRKWSGKRIDNVIIWKRKSIDETGRNAMAYCEAYHLFGYLV